MAIRIIQGVPGSGKTYYAVRHLAKNYCEQSEDGVYYLKDDVTVITNIDSFKPDHHDLRESIRQIKREDGKPAGADDFFNLPFQQALTDEIGGQIVYIIDEAQRFWRKGDRGHHEVYEYFELHRHLGHDIYFVTQNARKLPGDLVCLAEYIIDAAPRTRSLVGEMKYKWLSDGEVIKREAWKPEQAIFDLYKSMDMGEAEKIKNPVVRTIATVSLFIVLIAVGGVWYFKSHWARSKQHSNSTPTVAQQQKAPPSGSVPGTPIPQTPKTITVPISSFSETSEKGGLLRTTLYIVFQDVIYYKNSFPYPCRKIAGQWWADVPVEIIKDKPKEEVRRDSEAKPVVVSVDSVEASHGALSAIN
ncbi:MAG: zonular occludens toxin domain-containing protein [Desulfobulbus sp.]|nr:zonular occludens toxin domain-containing protein [Desulfobulbus sp.]